MLATLAQSIGYLLAEPFVAAALGLAAGVGLLVLSRSSFHLMRSDAPEAGLALVAGLLLGRMVGVIVVTLGYRALAPAGCIPFALAMAGGFVVAYTFELLRYGKLIGRGSVLRARPSR